MKQFPEPCWQWRLRQSFAAGTHHKAGLAADIVVPVALVREAHSAMPMLMPDWAWRPVVAVVEAWVPLVPA